MKSRSRTIFGVGDVEQACSLHGLVERARNDDGDGLAVVEDIRVLENADVAAWRMRIGDGELGRVEGREDGDDAGGALGGVSVDGLDGAGGDGGLHHAGVDEIFAREGLAELGGVLGGAGDLGDAVVAVRRLREGVRLLILPIMPGLLSTPAGKLAGDPGSLRGLREGADDALLGELDLEGVVLVAVGAAEYEIGSLAEGFGRGAFVDESGFGLARAPGLVRDSAEGEAGGANGIAVELEAGGDGDEREGVALAVAGFEVPGVLCEFRSWKSDGGDELVGLRGRCRARGRRRGVGGRR